MIAKNFLGPRSLAASGMFANVLVYRAKPNGLFKHQFIQNLCGFLVINDFLDSIFLFTSGYCFFHSQASQLTVSENLLNPYYLCFGQLLLFHYSNSKEWFNPSFHLFQKQSSIHAYQCAITSQLCHSNRQRFLVGMFMKAFKIELFSGRSLNLQNHSLSIPIN